MNQNIMVQKDETFGMISEELTGGKVSVIPTVS